jgi:hypothetical protein
MPPPPWVVKTSKSLRSKYFQGFAASLLPVSSPP